MTFQSFVMEAFKVGVGHQTTAGELIIGFLSYSKLSGPAELSLTWEYDDQPEELIPPSAFLRPSPTGFSYNYTVHCPTGYVKISDFE